MKVVLENELAERRTIGGREQDAGWGGCSLVVECLLSIPGALGSSPRTGWCVSAGGKPNRRVCEESLAFYRQAKPPRSLSINPLTAWMCWWTLAIPLPGRQRQENCCKFEDSLVYVVSSGPARAKWLGPVSWPTTHN